MEKLKNRQWLYHEYVELQQGTKSIAAKVGCSLGTVTRWLRNHEIPVRGFSSGKRNPPKGDKHPNWKGGQYVDHEGYIRARTPVGHPCKNRYIFLHRLIVEKRIGRFLLPTERVNHIDGNRQNNHTDNLQLCASQSEHAKLGMPGLRKHKKLWNREWLYQEYVLCQRSMPDIAQEVGCTIGTVKNVLKHYGISQRRYTVTEAALISRKKGGAAKKPR